PNALWRVLPWAIAACALIIAAWVVPHRAGDDMASRQVMHLDIDYPPNSEPVVGLPSGVAVSPDGQSVAMIGVKDGVRRLYIRSLYRPEATEVSGTVVGSGIAFSPDSASVAYNPGSSLTQLFLADRRQVSVASGVDIVGSVGWG